MTRKAREVFAKGRILIVDDDERNLLALSEVLSPIADVASASSGKDALRQLLKSDFAVILLDVFMPGMDGYETAAVIREREQTAKVPIIFLSAVNKETEHLMRGYAMGAVDYVFKPVDPIVLRSKVNVFVDLYDMRRQVEERSIAEQQLREAHYHEQLSRIEAERLLETSEKRQAALLDLLPLAIYEGGQGDQAGDRNFVGGDLTHFLGAEASAVLAGERAFDDWVHPEDRSVVTAHLAHTGDSATVEYRWVGPDGTMRHILDQRVAVDGDGDNQRWAGTLLDISERKRLEAQLVHVGKLDALGQLTGGVAHDFNNLLSAILGGLFLLKRRIQLEGREQILVEQMQHAAEQGAELVRRMMAFARQQELNPVSIDPASLCESVAGLVAHTLGGSVSVDWQCPKQSLSLFVDRGQLELALVNLILNARDAMAQSGGTVTVSIDRAVNGLKGHPALRIRVGDTGDGIPAHLIEKVTEPFFTTKDVGKGTGLGLSMVAGFVHQSGGELLIESVAGEGTSIELLLPATDARQPPKVANGQERDLDLNGGSLLLIDDDPSVRLVMAEQLREAGASVDEFSDGPSAIEAVRRSKKYQYIVCDFAMPGLDGLQTLRSLRELTPESRAILMTGHADDSRLTEDCEFPILRKPAQLESIVKSLLAA